MILMREKCTSSRSRDRHGLFFMNKQRMCVWAQDTLHMTYKTPSTSDEKIKHSLQYTYTAKHIKEVLSIFFHCVLLMSFEGVKRVYVSNVYR